jgi:signal peptidase I
MLKQKQRGPMSVSTDEKRKEGGLAESVRVVFHALLIALAIRILLFQAFSIPSGSMKATLLIGDYLFVSQFSYGYSHYSLPFSPRLFSGRIFGTAPERGDVAVFRLPKDDSTDYIKRVIGLPGDRIQMIDGLLHINGVPVKRERVADFLDDDNGVVERVRRWRETLPNGVTYETLDLEENGLFDNTPEYVVPPGHYFMMGDNRDDSADSRAPSGVGYVPFENFVGRAQIIFFSIGDGEPAWHIWSWPWSARWSRLFTIVR